VRGLKKCSGEFARWSDHQYAGRCRVGRGTSRGRGTHNPAREIQESRGSSVEEPLNVPHSFTSGDGLI